ncbi:hypothetical protein PT300_04545 [Enterobacteriaceae bacterium ESL0689]|nr:hypothetical protein [Enterobacteriaceae bacterium ESL0689]
MNLNNVTKAISSWNQKHRWSGWFMAIIFFCLVMVAEGFVLYALTSGITRLEMRLSYLESKNNTVATTVMLSTLQSQISTLEAGLASNQQRMDILQNDTETRSGSSPELAILQASSIQMQQAQQKTEAQLNALTEQLNALKTLPAAATPSPEKKLTEVKKPLSVKSHLTTQVVRNTPFVLTGVEKRGVELWAAVAPRDYHNLSQITLIGKGETVSGWTLVHAGHNEATFRANGRLIVLKVE